MALRPELLNLLDQLLLRMLDMDLVNTLRVFYSPSTPLAWLLAIALELELALSTDGHCSPTIQGLAQQHQGAAAQQGPYTLARAFLQLRQAFRVTDSGTLRRLDEVVLLSSTSLPVRARRGSDPVDSDVD